MSGCASTTITSFANTVFSITRQTYTGNKSAYTSVSTGNVGVLRPLTEEQATVNGYQYGIAYVLICDDAIDLREADKITDANSVVYDIRGAVAILSSMGFGYKRAILVKPEKS
jgi:hypothetical protein